MDMDRIHQESDCNQSADLEQQLQAIIFDEKNNSVTHIEDLSNEIFHEIFDYLDGCDIYQAFSNLNTRFQDLFNSPFLSLKFHHLSTSEEIFQNCYKNFLIPNRQRIISLLLWHRPHINMFLNRYPIDSSFNRLQSLVLKNITSKKYVTLYPILNSLSCLSSLTVRLGDQHPNISDVYQMSFQLRFLKYYKLSIIRYSLSFTSSFTLNQSFSAVEHLVINYRCAFNQLLTILSVTSQLRHLVCKKLVQRYVDFIIEEPITLPYFTHLSISECSAHFDDFEIFIKKICSQLQVFRLNIKFKDEDYLDTDRWKRLISQHMPQLRKFNFEYIQDRYNMFDLISHDTPSNIFTSSLLSEWKYFCEFVIYKDMTKYSIYSNKNRHCEMYDHIYADVYKNNFNLIQHIINRTELKPIKPIIQPTVLTVKYSNFIEFDLPIVESVQSFFSAIQFTHLNVDCPAMTIMWLIKLMQLLPHLDYLKIISMTLSNINQLSSEQEETLRLVSNNNKITKVHVTQLKDVTEADFLADLCPCMEYLEVECTKDMDLELLIVSILINQNIKCIPHLRTLCVHIQDENDVLTENLQQIIEVEKLLDNYSIKRIGNTIILQW